MTSAMRSSSSSMLVRDIHQSDRKSVVWGKSVDLGGCRIIKKKKKELGVCWALANSGFATRIAERAVMSFDAVEEELRIGVRLVEVCVVQRLRGWVGVGVREVM